METEFVWKFWRTTENLSKEFEVSNMLAISQAVAKLILTAQRKDLKGKEPVWKWNENKYYITLILSEREHQEEEEEEEGGGGLRLCAHSREWGKTEWNFSGLKTKQKDILVEFIFTSFLGNVRPGGMQYHLIYTTPTLSGRSAHQLPLTTLYTVPQIFCDSPPQ
ncbi:uncharacterized protein LOC144229739 [Crocuta crocuta]